MKYFDGSDLEALLMFYRTPTGARLLRVQGPLSTEEAQAIWRLITTREADFTRQFLLNPRGVR
jgi:Uncharacterized protein conserved in bacteria (DUF2059)